MPLDASAPALDVLLLNAAIQLELSARDRRVAGKRYGVLQDHLNHPASALSPYLICGRSLIHPQGSWSIGATIIHGSDDDRFDLDAVVEFPVPRAWRPRDALDVLEEALQGFPDALEVERCTRCVQLRFAFMHLDVTPIDPAAEPRTERVGEIFHHSKQRGEEERRPANPYGFTQWFRETVAPPSRAFQEAVQRARASFQKRDLISKGMTVFADTDIEDLPDPIDPLHDAPQVIALKLLKRFLNRRYAERQVRRPPPVYMTKIAALQPTNSNGLCAQIEQLAVELKRRMDRAIASGVPPSECNPRLRSENFNDRWPNDLQDMRIFRSDMQYLETSLARARGSEFSEIQEILADLFGERVSSQSAKAYLNSLSSEPAKSRFERGRGYVAAPAIGLAAGAAASMSSAPAHNFHPGVLGQE